MDLCSRSVEQVACWLHVALPCSVVALVVWVAFDVGLRRSRVVMVVKVLEGEVMVVVGKVVAGSTPDFTSVTIRC